MANQEDVPTLKWVQINFSQGPEGMSAEDALAWINFTSRPTIIDMEEEDSDEQR